MKSKIARKNSSRSAKLCTWNGCAAQHVVLILPPHHALGEEIDEGVGLGVHVVAVEHDLGVVEHLAQAPHQRLVLAASASWVRRVLRFTPSALNGA